MGGPLFANANRVFVKHLSPKTGFSTLTSAWPLFIILLRVQGFSLNLDRRRSCRHDLFLVSPENGCIFCKENVYLAHLAPIFGLVFASAIS